ncbi:phosphoinositide-specific phospholipase C [Exophiala viscosa]|uniref:Phosphoinositide phospholipase C n=1 Tax=Exophiala viscosa TaxID=2486360 RepID=A0AAN6DWN5_9EURO|nr:phosphoinositide-specific phospholipase C [Exophiala viscosa]
MADGPKLPAGAAGGGQPSEAVQEFGLQPFSKPVLSRLIEAYSLSSEERHRFRDQSSFLTYMASDESAAMTGPSNNDLNYTLSSYFISSSHNTYLSGHQLYGDASGESYKNVLRRGCRCLEIDVWDGDDSDSSTSDYEDEQGHQSSGYPHERSESKPSRWDRVKARAARIKSASRPEAFPESGKTSEPHTSTPSKDPQHIGASSLNDDQLSPHPSHGLSPKLEPRVLHGHTLTHAVSFRSVCHAIKDSAFLTTDLPIIVSLEVHACHDQQEVMVDIIREVWSGLLVDFDGDPQKLPTPESLRRKILIKVKWSPNTKPNESNNPVDHVTSYASDDSTEEGVATSSDQKNKAPKVKVLAALSELGIYTRAYTFKNFSQPEASIPTHVFSLSEKKMLSMHSDPYDGPKLFHHNKNYLVRVYPKGTRINSSNVDPTLHWRQGAQMVALNWQRVDKGMMLNEGMFAGTGGWMLKPEGYRCTGASVPAENMTPKKGRLSLAIKLLAAQRIPPPIERDSSQVSKIKPYVKANLHDAHGPLTSAQTRSNVEDVYDDEDDDKSVYKRRSSTQRTDCPDFDGERLSWHNVPDIVDELSFLR